MWPANQPLDRSDKLRPVIGQNANTIYDRKSSVVVNANKVTKLLFLLAGFIIITGIVLQTLFYKSHIGNFLLFLDNLFNVDEELNIPSFFSTILLLGSALLLFIITSLSFKTQDKHRWHWLVLSVGFLFLATDETITIHEHLNKPFKALLGNGSSGLLTFAWVVPGIIIVVGLLFVFWKFLFQLPEKTKNAFIIAGVFYIGGAVGIEMLGASYADKYGLVNLNYAFFTIVEESCEMAGIILFIRALLLYMQNRFKTISFDLK